MTIIQCTCGTSEIVNLIYPHSSS
uniref:Uncharacterized protein n=1 Tax=Anguilla anguilla TaxID=7936 RepID=A0A0E9T3D3_ANGAN